MLKKITYDSNATPAYSLSQVILIVLLFLFGTVFHALGQTDVDVSTTGLFTNFDPLRDGQSTKVARSSSDSSSDVQGFKTIRSRLVRINFERLTNKPLTLNLFEDTVFLATVEHTTPTESGYTISGRIENMKHSQVTLVVNGAVVVGSIVTHEATYAIRTVDEGLYNIGQVDASKFLPCGVSDGIALPSIDNSSIPPSRRPIATKTTALTMMGGNPVIDIIVFYTSRAKRESGGKNDIEALIDLAIAETNTAYRKSGVNLRINLVHKQEVNYTSSEANLHTVLKRFFDNDNRDGYIDFIHAYRDQYNADLVHLIVGSGKDFCGISDYGRILGITRYDCIPFYTFAHEIGHNMNLYHDRYTAEKRDELPASALRLRRYNFGYVNQEAFKPNAPLSTRWRTIMAYADECEDKLGVECQQVPYFSNPDSSYLGHAMGEYDKSNAVRTLNSGARALANARANHLITPPQPQGGNVTGSWIAEKFSVQSYYISDLSSSDVNISGDINGTLTFDSDGKVRADYTTSTKMGIRRIPVVLVSLCAMVRTVLSGDIAIIE